MKLAVTDIYTHHRPSKCDLRVYLKEKGVVGSDPSPYAQVLERLGQRHEKAHLNGLLDVKDLSETADVAEHLEKTRSALAAGLAVLYQPLLKVDIRLAGVDCEVSGVPDFLIKDELGYRIRDSKMSRRINAKDHPEIILQMQTYGWLFERVFQMPATKLEVHRGDGIICEVPYDGPDPVVDALRDIVSIRRLDAEPFSPVGHSKCSGCRFHDYCWPRAEAGRSVSLVVDVDQGLAVTLHEQGVDSMDQLIEKFDEASLSDLQRLQGVKLKRVGTKASAILRKARSMATGAEIFLRKPEIPISKNYVMFDLEGLPPQFDELQKVYLWGMQVFGETPSGYLASTAGFGPEGDREGWEGFLTNAAQIFDSYGDIPFVHWGTYEATFVKEYSGKRFGDDTGRAARVLKNLVNLLPITEKSIVLPVHSYGLKVLEKYVKFKRTLTEVNGDWAMAKYIEATETEDAGLRAQVMDSIRTYNREDLEATWAVLEWLIEKSKEYDGSCLNAKHP